MRHRRPTALVLLLAVLAATVLTAVPAAAGGGGCHRPASEARGTALVLEDLCFSPTVLRVPAGGEVTVVNRDSLDHPLARPGGEWGWAGRAGERTTIRLDRQGVYPFFCFAHPGMVGTVVVGDGNASAGATVVDVAGQPAGGARAADEPGVGSSEAGGAAAATTGSADPAAFPTAWLVLVALAALVGAAAGTRLARSRSS
jgi:plastocyanin